MKRFLFVVVFLLTIRARAQTQPTTNPALWQKLTEIDARAAKLTDLSADFEQEKHTTLLKKPLISRGRVRIAGSTMRWDTKQPEETVMLLDDKEAKMFYPQQKTLEIYSLGQHLGSLAASPLPKLSVLQNHFAFDSNDNLDGKTLEVSLTPTDKALAEHVDQVRVTLDVAGGFILRAEIDDADGDKTVINFTNIKPNTGLQESDLRLDPPAGTKVTRPLGALEK